MVTTLVELAGFACLVVAASMVSVALGFAVAGVSLLTVGYLLGRS